MSTTGVELSREQVLEMNKKLRHEGFVVDVSFRRKGHYITVSPKLLGADVDNNEELSDFFKKHVKSSKVAFLDDTIVRKAENVSKTTHKEKRKRSLGQTGSFMTREILDEFKEYLDKKKVEYFEQRDVLVDLYDEMVAHHKQEFKDKLVKNTMSSLSEQERDELVDKVFQRIPSKEEYFSSFDVTLRTTKVTLVDELDESEADDAMQDTIAQVNEITGKNLGIAFDCLNNLMERYHKDGSLNSSNKRVFTTVSSNLRKRNLFNDAMIESIIDLMTEFKSNGVSDEVIIEESEILVSKIYGYALEIGVAEDLNLADAALTEDEMLDLYELFNMEEVDEEVELIA